MKLFWGLLMMVLPTLVPAAAAHLVPAVPAVDFGLIKEVDGPVSRKLYILNRDTLPVTILRVVPTCGCTAADFYKDPVAPGDSAWIDLIYNPELRPGRFEKAIRIYPSHGETVRIPITGVVDASESTVDYLYPEKAGLLRLTQTQFMNLNPLIESERIYYADAYNSTDSPVWVKIVNEDSAVETDVDPNPVPPKERSTISLFVDPDNKTRKNESGYTVILYNSDSPDDIMNSTPVELKIITENHGTP